MDLLWIYFLILFKVSQNHLSHCRRLILREYSKPWEDEALHTLTAAAQGLSLGALGTLGAALAAKGEFAADADALAGARDEEAEAAMRLWAYDLTHKPFLGPPQGKAATGDGADATKARRPGAKRR